MNIFSLSAKRKRNNFGRNCSFVFNHLKPHPEYPILIKRKGRRLILYGIKISIFRYEVPPRKTGESIAKTASIVCHEHTMEHAVGKSRESHGWGCRGSG